MENEQGNFKGHLKNAEFEKSRAQSRWEQVLKEKKDIQLDLTDFKYKMAKYEGKFKEAETKLAKTEAQLSEDASKVKFFFRKIQLIFSETSRPTVDKSTRDC